MPWRAANQICSIACRVALLPVRRRIVPPFSQVDHAVIASTIGSHASSASSSFAFPSAPFARHNARR